MANFRQLWICVVLILVGLPVVLADDIVQANTDEVSRWGGNPVSDYEGFNELRVASGAPSYSFDVIGSTVVNVMDFTKAGNDLFVNSTESNLSCEFGCSFGLWLKMPDKNQKVLGTSATAGVTLNSRSTNGTLLLYSTTIGTLDSLTVYPVNTWQYVVIVINETTGKEMWINGELNSSKADNTLPSDKTSFYIGGYDAAGDLDGSVYCPRFFNASLNSSQIALLFNGGEPTCNSLAVLESAGAVSSGLNFKVKDATHGVFINNISVLVYNSSHSFRNSSQGGEIIQPFDVSNENFTYSVILSANNSNGSYYNSSFLAVVNSSDVTYFIEELAQAWTTVRAVSGVLGSYLNTFNVSWAGNNYFTTSGGVLLPVTAGGDYTFTVFSEGYTTGSGSFSYSAVTNTTSEVVVGINKTFNLIDEVTLAPFNVNSTNRTRLEIICSNMSIFIDFNGTTSSTVAVPCAYDFIKIGVSYNSTYNSDSYYRTLIPPYNENPTSIFLVDLTTDAVVQQDIQLRDLTGDYSEGVIRAKRIYGFGEADIIEQLFDIQDVATLFLLRDAVYVIEVVNGDGDIVSLGNLIGTSSGTKVLSLPSIEFVPDNSTFGGAVNWDYNFSVDAGVLRVVYRDALVNTTYFRFRVYNASDTSQLFFDSGVLSGGDITSTYNGVVANVSYASWLVVSHVGAGGVSEWRVWGAPEIISRIEGFDSDFMKDFFRWVVLVFVIVIGLLFTAASTAAGLFTMATFLWIFRMMNFIPDVPAYQFWFVISIVYLIAGFTWFNQDKRRDS